MSSPSITKESHDLEEQLDHHQNKESESNHTELPFLKVLVIMCTLIMSMFLVSLDRTIIGVAIPTITDEFHSIDDVGWYGSAYMLTNASLQLLFGRIYKFNPVKKVFITSILIFDVGSAVCGAAPNSVALIIGRAIAGAGASGIFSGAIQVMLAVVPLHKRPMWQATFGMVFGLSAALGPLVGGAFTQNVSWRWCFYINLPVGAIAVAVIVFFLKVEEKKMEEEIKTSTYQHIKRLDPFGLVLLVPSVVCLLLALQYGGFVYPWSDARVMALLVIFAVFLVAFIASQWYMQDNGMLPPRVFLQRSVLGGFGYMFLLSGSLTIMVYYVPIWFQAVKGSAVVESSYQTLPSILSLVVASVMAGIIAKKSGYYAPQMMISPVLSSIGVGLMTTWTPSTASPKWIGYQFMYGFGLGLGMQGSSLAVQTVLPKSDVPIGIAAIFFAQQMGGAIFVSVAENLLTNKLASLLSAVPGLDAEALSKLGALEIRTAVSPALLPQIVKAYTIALHDVWYAALALTAAMIIPYSLIEWRNIKKGQEVPPKGEIEPMKE